MIALTFSLLLLLKVVAAVEIAKKSAINGFPNANSSQIISAINNFLNPKPTTFVPGITFCFKVPLPNFDFISNVSLIILGIVPNQVVPPGYLGNINGNINSTLNLNSTAFNKILQTIGQTTQSLLNALAVLGKSAQQFVDSSVQPGLSTSQYLQSIFQSAALKPGNFVGLNGPITGEVNITLNQSDQSFTNLLGQLNQPPDSFINVLEYLNMNGQQFVNGFIRSGKTPIQYLYSVYLKVPNC